MKTISTVKNWFSTSQASFLLNVFILFLFLTPLISCDSDDDILDEKEPALALIAEGLTSPVTLVEAPDGSGNIFITDQVGKIKVINSEGNLQKEPFLDITDKIVELNEHYDERGLLGLAFHPEYQTNGRFFVYYSAPLRPEAPADWDHTSHISEFKVSSNPLTADKSTERILLKVDQPQTNHNAGTLAFGPQDNYLYISIGDGGNRDDEGLGHVADWYEDNAGGNGQNITENFLGDILRIDVDSGDPYGIPGDNPFINSEGLDEIYAFGFRNPYRFSFDMSGDHALYVGDAGQEMWEEVSIVGKGGNYGWNVKEGTHCFDAENPENPPANCPETDPNGNALINPIIEFKNAHQSGGVGLVMVGGYVYRGNALPGFDSNYIFGTWSAEHDVPDGKVFSAQPGSESLWDFQEINFANTPNGELNSFLLGFGQDAEGEIYILTTDTGGPSGHSGKVYKLISE